MHVDELPEFAGETWVREALEALRADGYSGQAWRLFLRRSLERAQETKAARPDLARQSRAWATAGFAAVPLTRRVMPPAVPRPSLAPSLAWWASVCAMVNWHLGMLETMHEPRWRRLATADALTLTRVWLVPLVASRQRNRSVFLFLLAIGATTDVLDGRLAERAGSTRLGRDLDRTADISFFGAAALGAMRSGWIDGRSALAVAFRYALPVAVTAAHYFTRGSRPPEAEIDGRWASSALVAGLAVAPRYPKLGSTIVTLSCTGWIVQRIPVTRPLTESGSARPAQGHTTASSGAR
jgi:phosphatidylglycerophosphate synthase